MTVDISRMTSQQALSEIAKMAYGSGRFEGTDGGKGNIGLVNGHVVKFNTHWTERRGTATDDMRTSCNQLRTRLGEIAADLLAAKSEDSTVIAEQKRGALAAIRSGLGLDPSGTQVVSKSLLDRKVVARVINELSQVSHEATWDGVTDVADSLSSKGIDTHFSVVNDRVIMEQHRIASDQMVDQALAELATPAPDRTTFTLTPEQTDFMKALVLRERCALLAAGKPVSTADEFKASVLSYNSPAFVATMFAFGRLSSELYMASNLANKNSALTAYLAGAPNNERLDRVDLFMTACNSTNRPSFLNMGSVSLLKMCEKLPEMRRLQPEGRLTCETIWKACFNEALPPELSGMEGTSLFADRLDLRTDEVVKDLFSKILPSYKDDPDLLYARCQMLPMGAGILELGATPEAFVKNGLKAINFNTSRFGATPYVPDIGYIFDPSTEKMSRGYLYMKEAADNHTDTSIRDQLIADFKRQHLTVNIVDRSARHPTVIDLRNFINQSQDERENAVRNLMDKIDAFVGSSTSTQRKVVLFGFSQAGMSPLRSILGGDAEHSDATITISRDPKDSNRIIMSYQTAKNVAYDVRYGYAIDADGSNAEYGKMSLHRRRT